MGDDLEIRQLIRNDSKTFLKSALEKSKSLVSNYDFNAEFAGTKKNKSFVVVGATLATIAALGIAAYFVTVSIERQAARAPVDVKAFDDLNLKDVLDSSKRDAGDLERVNLEIGQAEYDYKSGLATADRDYKSSVEAIKAQTLAPADEEARLAAVATAYDAAKKKALASYNANVAAKTAERAAIQARLDRYDSRLMAQAKKQQTVLASQRSAFDIEKNRQAQLYEAQIADLKAARASDVAELGRQKAELAALLTTRYNPTFTDPRSMALLSGPKPQAAAGVPAFQPYLTTAGVLDSDAEAKLDRSLSDFLYLSDKLGSVPYLNSVPPALAKMQNELRTSIIAYRQALAVAGSGLEDRDKAIATLKARAETAEKGLSQYEYAVAAIASDNRESGFVLDPRDGTHVVVYLAPTVNVTDGAVGYAARKDKVVAVLQFHVNGASVSASVTSLVPGQTLRPFDSILVGEKAAAAVGLIREGDRPK